MNGIKDQIKTYLKKHGVLSFHQIHEFFPHQPTAFLDEVLHEMVDEGSMQKHLEKDTGETLYYKRFYTKSGDTMVFHYKDHPESHKFSTVVAVDDMPWFFEPIDYKNDHPYSTNYESIEHALKVAEERENEEDA